MTGIRDTRARRVKMGIDVGEDFASLKRMTVGQLCDRCADLFGAATMTGNKTWLVRGIA